MKKRNMQIMVNIKTTIIERNLFKGLTASLPDELDDILIATSRITLSGVL